MPGWLDDLILAAMNVLMNPQTGARAMQEASVAMWGFRGVTGAGIPYAAATAAQRVATLPEGRSGALPEQDPSLPVRMLMGLAAGMQAAINFEMQLTSYLAAIPWPALPSLRVWDLALGLPHAHAHPPNLIPPNPVPIPLPSIGPILPIPFLSGASKTFINGQAAARCGDMGLGIWCGGFFPIFQLFLGSATVWTENARQARLLTDVTTHCIFTIPKPSDPPLGPMLGLPVPLASYNVLTGGIPMPSLFAMAMGLAFKYLFKGIGALYRALTAKSFVANLLKRGNILIVGDDLTRLAVIDDLLKIARTPTGRQLLVMLDAQLAKTGVTVRIVNAAETAFGKASGAEAARVAQFAIAIPDKLDDGVIQAAGKASAGTGSIARYVPGVTFGSKVPMTSDLVLMHELVHSLNYARGTVLVGLEKLPVTGAAQVWYMQWTTPEEFAVIASWENAYRVDTGLVLRWDHFIK